MKVKIGNQYIGDKQPVFVIAELSANHEHKIEVAVESIKAAKKAGVNAIKVQTYTPDTMTIDVDNKYFRVNISKWKGQTLYNLYKQAYTPWEWFKDLKKVADDLDIMLFSTPFDKTAVDFLEQYDVPIYKIASFELNDLPLIEYVAKTKKTMIMSTGMATYKEIEAAVKTAKNAGAKHIILLRCVSSYPADPENMNLVSLVDLRKKTGCLVGLSDHTIGSTVPVAAVALGACVVEKHFTLCRQMKSPDSFFSMEPEEWKNMVQDIRIAEKAMGKIHYGPTEDEKKSRNYRRSLFVVEDIKKGGVFTESNIRCIRPAFGLPPAAIKNVLGKRAARNLKKGMPLTLAMISKNA